MLRRASRTLIRVVPGEILYLRYLRPEEDRHHAIYL